ncbi:acetoacetate--CoA ligase [Vibrio renipiscarius]|nr:acetoacetate--CoA ligase [Vibrio renipiscarius]
MKSVLNEQIQMPDPESHICWQPSNARVQTSRLTHYIKSVFPQASTPMSYRDLHNWSVQHNELFWQSVWQFCQVVGQQGRHTKQQQPAKWQSTVKHRDTLWFDDSTLNYAENLLTGNKRCHAHQDGDKPLAIIYEREDGQRQQLTWTALTQQVSVIQQWLQQQGVTKGDVVAAYVPYGPQSVIAMLATTSLGATWTSTSPDFGVESVVERFGQVAPKVLFCAENAHFAGKIMALHDKNIAIIAALPTLRGACCINAITPTNVITPQPLPSELSITFTDWQTLLHQGEPGDVHYTDVPFNHPLFILYSSGTTGKPKCIIHSVGGTLLNHLKEHQLHCDIQPADRVFYYTTCGWMMWNWHVSALASGATLVIYDGSPVYPNAERLWQLAERERVSLFGTSAKYLEHIEKAKIAPQQKYKLDALKTLCSTGSVLYPDQFDYIYQHIKRDLHLASISGGTDICGCFVLGNPISPVYRGECQAPGLGLDVAAFNVKGQNVIEQRGELVCCNSFPNQPIGFLNDDGQRYHNAYWQRFDNAWHHGDDIMMTRHGGVLFFGRSDATLNPGGVRIGTSEIYGQVNLLNEVVDSLAVGHQVEGNEIIILFVQLKPTLELNDALIERIKSTLKRQCSPRHVPSYIFAISDVPKTKSGKLVELAVKRLLNGEEIENLGAIANPDIFEEIEQVWNSK